MNFKYTDLPKDKNFIGFESGIMCLYPNINGTTYITNNPEKDFGCPDNDFYLKRYKVDPPPHYYDPRCRPWYKQQFNLTYSTFSDVYTYATGVLGITNCAPLWANMATGLSYRGAYCFDLYPTSDDQFFVQKYYMPEKGAHVDYLIFTEDEAFKNNDLENSAVTKYLQSLVFEETSHGRNF
jgi:hypothetical protein